MAGVFGYNANLLYYPYSLAFDSSNNLYVAGYYTNRIQKLITNTSITVTVAGNSNSTAGDTNDLLRLPNNLLFDANNNIYITDRGNNRIQFWANGATSGTTVAGRKLNLITK